MKALYTPKNHTAEELLKSLGFVSANKGFVLKSKSEKRGQPTQIHALIELDGAIDLHEDFEKDGRHFARRTGRVNCFIEIIARHDAGKPLEMHPKIKRQYAWAGEKSEWEPMRKYL